MEFLKEFDENSIKAMKSLGGGPGAPLDTGIIFYESIFSYSKKYSKQHISKKPL